MQLPWRVVEMFGVEEHFSRMEQSLVEARKRNGGCPLISGSSEYLLQVPLLPNYYIRAY